MKRWDGACINAPAIRIQTSLNPRKSSCFRKDPFALEVYRCVTVKYDKLSCIIAPSIKVRKKAKIRHRYNQVPHLTQETTWNSDKNTRKHHIQESEEVSPFPACGTLFLRRIGRKSCIIHELLMIWW